MRSNAVERKHRFFGLLVDIVRNLYENQFYFARSADEIVSVYCAVIGDAKHFLNRSTTSVGRSIAIALFVLRCDDN